MTQENTPNLEQGTTIPLSEANTTPQQESSFDKGLKNVVGFFAKMTGQPDPQTGQPHPQDQSQPSQEVPKKTGFFQGLFSKTQEFFQKTSNFATTISEKTQNIAGQVVEKTTAVKDTIVNAPTMVADKANAVLDKGMQMGEQLKDTIQTNAENLTKDPMGTIKNVGNQTLQAGQNLTSQAVNITNQAVEKVGSEASNFAKDPLAATQNLGNQAVKVTSQTVEKVSTGAGEFIENPLEATQNLSNQVVEKTQETLHAQTSSSTQDDAQQTGLIRKFGQGLEKVFEKTKEIGSQTLEKTTDFVKNPVENIDAIAGQGGAEATTVPTETENTTSLENLDASPENPTQEASISVDPTKNSNQPS